MSQGGRKLKGVEIEQYVKAMVAEFLPCVLQANGSDFLVSQHTLLEVKSAELCQSNGKDMFLKAGKFVVNPIVHGLLCVPGYSHWYALVLTFRSRVLLLCFLPAKRLDLLVAEGKAPFSNFYCREAVPLECFVKWVKENDPPLPGA